jgi:hypothetical protein
VLLFWRALHVGAPGDARAVAKAIEVDVVEDELAGRAPVFGSREKDAAVMAYYALRESWLVRGAVGDGGKSFGYWQQEEAHGRGPAERQGRYWLALLREGERSCPASPAAPLSGGCKVREARALADHRVKKALEVLDQVLAELEPREAKEESR